MKIDPASSLPGAAQSQAPKPAAEGFRGLMEALGGAGKVQTPASVAAATSAASVSSVGSLLAMQGGGPGEARALALRKGRRLLEALDRLQLAMLGDGPTSENLRSLQGALSESRSQTDDPELDETLGWAEVRVAVEAAKLSR
jgi:hypothetical protein